MKKLLGFDIGGTKCAVIFARTNSSERPEILEKIAAANAYIHSEMHKMCEFLHKIMHNRELYINFILFFKKLLTSQKSGIIIMPY